MDNVQVLNGTVKIGDKIAYATRRSSYMDMNIATVLDITERPHGWREEMIPVLRVQVTESTDIYNLPRNTTIRVLDRVVKL